jgi:hypothetical protein
MAQPRAGDPECQRQPAAQLDQLGHGVMISDPCPLSMARAFITDPSKSPDPACISRMHGPAWVTG